METKIAVLETNFKRYIDEGKEEKKRQSEKLDQILEQVKSTNGRVKSLEVEKEIEKALQTQFKNIITFLASIGALGGIGAFAPQFINIFF